MKGKIPFKYLFIIFKSFVERHCLVRNVNLTNRCSSFFCKILNLFRGSYKRKMQVCETAIQSINDIRLLDAHQFYTFFIHSLRNRNDID